MKYVHNEMTNSGNSSKWPREPKMSSTECAMLLYNEIELLMQDNDVFYEQYNLLVDHYRRLSREIMAA